MAGGRDSSGSHRDEERALLRPGRGGECEGDDDDDGPRFKVPGCLGFFAGLNKRRTVRTIKVAAAPSPSSPPLGDHLFLDMHLRCSTVCLQGIRNCR
jgi:hypothetical protein